MEQQPSVSRIGSTIDNAQQGSGESQQLKETVETKVDQMSGQTHHLERAEETTTGENMNTEEWRKFQNKGTHLICKFVFLLVVEGQLIVQDVIEIFLHERHGVGEAVLLVVSAVVHIGVITEKDMI